MNKVLIVDDEKEIADLVEIYLKMTDIRFIRFIMEKVPLIVYLIMT